MSDSFVFIGANFSLESVNTDTSGILFIKFSATPLQTNPTGPNDGLNPSSYLIVGPTTPSLITSINAAGSDTQTLALNLNAPLSNGNWSITVSNVRTPEGVSLSPPVSLNFSITNSIALSSLSNGAKNDNPEDIIRKHLSPAMKGDGWDSLITGLAIGDEIVQENARTAFDQLFKISASGKYLNILNSNEGLSRPPIGMSDETFRQLGIATATNKITHESIREVLEVFYGQDACRAFAESDSTEPFRLIDGQTLTWVTDEQQEFSHTFTYSEFTNIAQASAMEIASVLSKTMQDNRSKSFALEVNGKVRIYSGSLGIKSFVKITDGTAQPILNFPTKRDVCSGEITSSLNYSWTYSHPTPYTTKLELTTVNKPLIDVSFVEEGDVLIISSDAQSINGTYTINQISFSWSGLNFTQTIDLNEYLDFTGGAVQLSNNAYYFFKPEKRTILNNKRNTTITQTSRNEIDITIPSTTQAINRQPKIGAYLGSTDSLSILRYVRDGNGIVTVQTSIPHNLQENDQIFIEGIQPQNSQAWVSPGASTSVSEGTTDASFMSHFSGLNNARTPSGQCSSECKGTILGNGNLLITGGWLAVSGGILSETSNDAVVFQIDGSSVVTDDSEANGSSRLTYQYPYNEIVMNSPRQQHGITTLLDGRAIITGGFGEYSGGTTPSLLNTVDLSNTTGNEFTAINTLNTARFGHEQITLDDGRVMVIGGAWNRTTATNSVEFYNPTTTAWTSGPDMTEARYGHKAVKLNNGKVMVIGGMGLGSSLSIDSNVLGYWKFDETVGNTAQDDSPNSYTLTGTNSPLIADGKVNNCRDFSPTSSYMSASGDSTAQNALLDGWTIQFWLPDVVSSASDLTIVGYMGSGGTEDDNVLFQIGVNSDLRVWWKWQYGVGVDVLNTQTTGQQLTTKNSFVTLRKSYNGSNYDVDLFINGILTQSWTGITNASGGATSSWIIGDDLKNPGTGFAQKIDELYISSTALSNDNIIKSFYLGMGESKFLISDYQTTNFNESNRYRTGITLKTTEIFDPNTDTWSYGPDLNLSRGFHTATLLSNGNILVTGGFYRNLNDDFPLLSQNYLQYWPNQITNTTEEWDSNTNRFAFGPQMTIRRAKHHAVLIRNNQIWISGGEGYQLNYNNTSTLNKTNEITSTVELLNTDTNIFSISPTNFYRDTAIPYNEYIFCSGGLDDNDDALTNYDLWVSNSDISLNGGLNKTHKVTSILNSTKFQFITSSNLSYTSNFGDLGNRLVDLDTESDYGSEPRYQKYSNTNGIVITAAIRSSDITTLTVTSTSGIISNDLIFVNINSNSFSNGIKTVLGVTVNSISYSENDIDVSNTPTNGIVSKNLNSNATITKISQLTISPKNNGPYIYDVLSGVNLLPSINTKQILGAFVDEEIVNIKKKKRYTILVLDSTDGIPNEPGYLLADFGGSSQSLPIKYLSVIDNQKILIDFNFVFQHNYTNKSIVLLKNKTPYIPNIDSYCFYATGSHLGTLTAISIINDIAASGFNVNINVSYPGDRGLGGEGFSLSGTGKLSDIVKLWSEDGN